MFKSRLTLYRKFLYDKTRSVLPFAGNSERVFCILLVIFLCFACQMTTFVVLITSLNPNNFNKQKGYAPKMRNLFNVHNPSLKAA